MSFCFMYHVVSENYSVQNSPLGVYSQLKVYSISCIWHIVMNLDVDVLFVSVFFFTNWLSYMRFCNSRDNIVTIYLKKVFKCGCLTILLQFKL